MEALKVQLNLRSSGLNMKIERLHQTIETFLSTAKKPLIVLTGPTACGKTALSIKLCQQYGGAVINADSRQVYTDIRIGNALVSEEERQGIPHHLFSFRSPLNTLTVAEYKTLVEEKMSVLQGVSNSYSLKGSSLSLPLSRGSSSEGGEGVWRGPKDGVIPFLVGGSVMWISAVTENYDFPEGAFNPKIREAVSQLSLREQLSELKKLDPESFKKLILEMNPRYIARAVEIARTTGKPKSVFKKGPRKYDVLKLVINRPREELYSRINARVHQQLNNGLLNEVEILVKKYLPTTHYPLPTAFLSIGVKEVIPYLQGNITKEQMIADLQQASRNYAKRQLTWLRKDKEIVWITP